MRSFAVFTFLLLSLAFFLLFQHLGTWLIEGSAGHLSVWQNQVADWLLVGP